MLRVRRRDFLKSLPALAAAPRLLAQAPGSPLIPVRALNHMTLSVSDPKRSIDFYQGLFGMPIQARQGQTTLLRIGAGPQFLALSGAGANGKPSINHYCLTVDNFDADRALAALAKVGVTRAEGPGGGLSGGPLKARVRMRGPESGGAPGGTPELYFGDPDGIVVQLQARQGPNAPLLGVGTGVQFLMFTGGAGAGRAGAPAAPPRPASINHVCMNMENFKP